MLERGTRPSLIDGCRAELAKLGVEIEQRLVLRVETTAECRAAVARLEAEGGGPTAYVISPFALAPRMLTAISDNGLSVPDDVSVVCHGDSDWALAYRPPLAVIRRDYHAQAAAWVRELISRLDGRPSGPVPNLAYEFLPRGSIGPVSLSRGGPGTAGPHRSWNRAG
jgi:LacI family transcriptional regulator